MMNEAIRLSLAAEEERSKKEEKEKKEDFCVHQDLEPERRKQQVLGEDKKQHFWFVPDFEGRRSMQSMKAGQMLCPFSGPLRSGYLVCGFGFFRVLLNGSDVVNCSSAVFARAKGVAPASI